MNKYPVVPMTKCIAPWINLSTDVDGSTRPCCKFTQPNKDGGQNEFNLPAITSNTLDEVWNHPEWKRLRQTFIDGNFPKSCGQCLDEEQAGVISLRQHMLTNNSWFSRVEHVNMSSTYSPFPQTYDLKLNNVCNLKCRMCGPQASSLFLKEDKENGIVNSEEVIFLQNKIMHTPNEEIFKTWIPYMTHIELFGGEPFAGKENIEILKLIDQNADVSKITIALNTNGTIFNKGTIDTLLKFHQVGFTLSIDDLFDRIEYIRYPSNWNILHKNIDRFRSYARDNDHFKLHISNTVQIYNLWHLDEFVHMEKGWPEIQRFWNFLHYPSSLNICNLPDKIKEQVSQKYENIPELKTVVDFMNIKTSEHDLSKFWKNVNKFDQRRNQKFQEVFPEWFMVLNG